MGEFCLPAYSIHSVVVPRGVHTEFAERADPDPARKLRFLRLLLGRNGQEKPLSMLQSMRLFYEDGEW